MLVPQKQFTKSGDIPCSLICILALINLEQCVGHLITKTIIEIAQGHILLSATWEREDELRAEFPQLFSEVP
jgi:hypothetical protein